MKALSPRLAFSHSRRPRGTVIMLVVAIMTLLMIIGTVYIFTTRADRSSARQTAEAFNFDLARNSALDIIRDRLFMQTAYPAPTAPNMAAAPYTQGAILVRPPFWSTNVNQYNIGDIVTGTDGRLFRCIVQHAPSATQDPATMFNNPPPANVTKWQVAPATAVSSGYAEMRDLPNNAGWTMNGYLNSTNNPGYTSNMYLATDLVASGISANGGDYSIIWPRRYNPSTGAYDLTFGATPPAGSEISVVYAEMYPSTPPSVLTNDGIWHLLTYSSGNTRYRFAFRAIDTNRMLNLNVGNHNNSNADRTGTYLTGYQLNNSAGGAFNASDAGNVARLHQGTGTLRGRNGNTAAFDLATWEGECLGWEKYGANSYAGTSATAEWFDFTDELELRAYAQWGTTYVPRHTGNAVAAGQIWYNTLTHAKPNPVPPNLPLVRNQNRDYFTNYSFDRNIGPTVNARFRLTTPGGQNYTWPGGNGSNRMINLKDKTPDVDEIARNAIYFANALAAAGYTEDECLQAAVNYAGQAVLQIGGIAVSEEHPAPPAIVAGSGLVLIKNVTTASTYNIVNLFTGLAPSKTYLAYYAQPYLNEVAVARNPPQSDPGEAVQDFAVEIVNPHLTAIDLKRWRIRVGGNVWIPNLGQSLSFVPITPHGFNYINTTGANFPGAAATVAGAFDPAGQLITLERPYYVDGTGIPQYMVVDQIQMNFPAPGAYNPGDTTTNPRIFGMQRNNTVTGNTSTKSAAGSAAIPDHDWWMCTSPVIYSTGAATVADATGGGGGFVNSMAPSFGTPNAVAGDNTRYGIEMIDRFTDGTGASGATPASVLSDKRLARENVGDICGYMLIGSNSGACVTQYLQDDPSLPRGLEANAQFQQETKARLNFIRDPRAQALLTMLAGVDRASDGVDQIGSGSADSIDETRIPGRININTAPMAVLRAVMDNLYTTSGGVVNTAKSIAACQAIIDYRNRTGTFANFNNGGSATGFKNLGELIYPLAVADGNATVVGGVITFPSAFPDTNGLPYNYASLDKIYNPTYFRRPSPDGTRSASVDLFTGTWAKLFTTCTVRSDTFIIYGYIEAIRSNPQAGHNNTSEWYAPTTDTGGSANVRIGFRRFVAIVDRSWSNSPKSSGNFQMPRIIGVRELPK